MRALLLIVIFFVTYFDMYSKDRYLIISNDSFYNSEILKEFIEYREIDFEVFHKLNNDIGKTIAEFQNYISSINPQYILLVGGHSDFPSKIIPYSSAVESYNYWVSEQTDSLFSIQIPIGLFFVDNTEELSNIIHKTISFEKNLENIPKKIYTHAGGNPTEPLEPWVLEFNDEILFEMYNSFFKSYGYMHRHETSLDETPNDALSDVQAINNDVKYILYHGHGNIQKWSFGMGVLGIPFLTNSEYFPVVFSASCLTGTFTGKIDTLETDCFATKMLASKNGAVAFIGAFNTSSRGQNPLLYGFSKEVNKNERLGDVIIKAINNKKMPETVKKYYPYVTAQEYNRALFQFHLFGDPALKINIIEANVENKNLLDNIIIFPNPASDFIEINHAVNGVQPLVQDTQIEIYNLLGERVINILNRQASSNHRIDISFLPAGIYTLRFSTFSKIFVK